jgi:AcrR family transcriptional regulator
MTAIVKTSVRERLIDIAGDLFYLYGLRAVSVDKIVDAAGTTKVSFYRHFASKDLLVVAYLERRAQLERTGVTAAINLSDGDVDASLRMIAEQTGLAACGPGFRGCAFINAAAEYPDPSSAVRAVVSAHREWYRSTFESLLAPLALTDAAATAEDLLLVRDGAMVAGYLDEPATLAAKFLRAARAVIPH